MKNYKEVQRFNYFTPKMEILAIPLLSLTNRLQNKIFEVRLIDKECLDYEDKFKKAEADFKRIKDEIQKVKFGDEKNKLAEKLEQAVHLMNINTQLINLRIYEVEEVRLLNEELMRLQADPDFYIPILEYFYTDFHEIETSVELANKEEIDGRLSFFLNFVTDFLKMKIQNHEKMINLQKRENLLQNMKVN